MRAVTPSQAEDLYEPSARAADHLDHDPLQPRPGGLVCPLPHRRARRERPRPTGHPCPPRHLPRADAQAAASTGWGRPPTALTLSDTSRYAAQTKRVRRARSVRGPSTRRPSLLDLGDCALGPRRTYWPKEVRAIPSIPAGHRVGHVTVTLSAPVS